MRSTRAQTLGGLPVQIDTGARDFVSIRDALMRLLPDVTPEWTDLDPSDPGVLMLEAVAYIADVINYSVDRAQNESYLPTAQDRTNVVNLLKLIDYNMSMGSGSSVPMCVITGADNVLIPANTKVSVGTYSFEFTQDIVLPTAGVYAPSSVRALVEDQLGVAVTPFDDLIAYFGESKSEVVGTSNGQMHQTYKLNDTQIAISTQFPIQIMVGAERYDAVRNFLDTEPTSAVFVTSVDDAGLVTVRFGNGATGKIPPNGELIVAYYRRGVGSTSNSVGSNTLKTLSPTVTGVLSVYNPVQPSGGKDPETIYDAKQNAPLTLRALDRAVTLQDYETLAVQNPFGGVKVCRAVSNDPYDVTVYIAAEGSNPMPTGVWYPTIDTGTGLLGAVGRWLVSKSVVGTHLNVLPPNLVSPEVTASIRCNNNILTSECARIVRNNLRALFEDSSSSFGVGVPLSKLIQTIENSRGVDFVNMTEFHRSPSLYIISGDTAQMNSANMDILVKPTSTSARYRVEWVDATRYKLYANGYGYIRSSFRATRPTVFQSGTVYQVYTYNSSPSADIPERVYQFDIRITAGSIFPFGGSVWGFCVDDNLGNIALDSSELLSVPLTRGVLDNTKIRLSFVGGI